MRCSSFTIAWIINTAIIWASTRETLSSGGGGGGGGGGLRTTQAQTNLRITQSVQHLFIHFLESIICKLAAGEISIFKLVSIAEETGLKHSLSTPPPEDRFFSQRGPYDTKQSSVLRKKIPKKKGNASGFSSFHRHGRRHFIYNAINPHKPNVLLVGHR